VGRGGFARVFRARRKSDNRIIAVKIPLSLDESTGRGFVREIRVWEDLKHENVVACLDCNVLPIPYLILEYMSRGSLEDYLTKQGKPLDVAEVVRISLGIARGLKYAHNIPPPGHNPP
jgi:serine/threonine protein kinase